MTHSLKLAEEQQARIRTGLEEYVPRILEARQAMHLLRRQLVAQYAAPEFDTVRFRELAEELSRSQGRLDSLTAEAMMMEAAVLMPDQRDRYSREMPWGRADLPGEVAMPPRRGP